MQKFPFVDNAWTIFEVSRAQHVDMGVAFDMLKADIRNGVPYNTQREDIDFVTLKDEFDALEVDVQNQAIDAWSEFYALNFKALTAAWLSENKSAFQEIIDNA